MSTTNEDYATSHPMARCPNIFCVENYSASNGNFCSCVGRDATKCNVKAKYLDNINKFSGEFKWLKDDKTGEYYLKHTEKGSDEVSDNAA